MNHYITPDNKTWGFDDTQVSLIPSDAVLIPTSFTFDKYPYLTLVNGVVEYNQSAHDAVTAQAQAAEQVQATAKASAISKLTALGLTSAEITALTGVTV